MRVDAKTAILQALTEGEGFGLEIQSRIETRTAGRICLSGGSIYPGLRELERQGLIESFEGETVPERLGRPRVYYRLTGEGRRVAQEEREEAQGLFGLGRQEPAFG